MKQVTKTRWLTISFLKNMLTGVVFCVGYYFIAGLFWGALSDNVFENTAFLDKAAAGSFIGLLSGCNFGVVFVSTASILTSLLTYIFRKKLSPQKGMILGFLLGILPILIAIIGFYCLPLFFLFRTPVLDASYLASFVLMFVIPGLFIGIGMAIENKKMLRDYEIK